MGSDGIVLHLGCGSVYLKGCINVDIKKPGKTKTTDNLIATEELERHTTTFDKYYKHEFQKDKSADCNIIDYVADISNRQHLLNIKRQEGEDISGIIAVQVLEHFPQDRAEAILEMWISLLKIGGFIIISVPDIVKTASHESVSKDPRYIARLVYGSQVDEYSFHKSMFHEKYLKGLMSKFGLERISSIPNFHEYPATILKGIKK